MRDGRTMTLMSDVDVVLAMSAFVELWRTKRTSIKFEPGL